MPFCLGQVCGARFELICYRAVMGSQKILVAILGILDGTIIESS